MNTTLFLNNKTQAVRIPASLRFDDNIKEVSMRKVGNERIISPQQNIWDSFFLNENTTSDDFMLDKPKQLEATRENLDD
jgi:antitoxin VapB